MTRICAHPNCNKELPANKRADALYCSNKCKTEASYLSKAAKLQGLPPKMGALTPTAGGNEMATQFIINQQNEKIKELKAELKDEKEKRINAEQTTRDQEKEILEINHQHEKEALEKPSGLQGFIEKIPNDQYPVLLNLLQGLAGKLFTPQGGPIAGTAQGSTEGQTVLQWFESLPQEAKILFYNEVIVPLSSVDISQGELTLINTIKSISLNQENQGYGS